MSPLEQQALVARQLAALLRHGRSWSAALELVEPGLPAGPVRAWLEERRREAAAGREADEPTAEALEQEALGVEARLEADAALRLARVFLSFSLGGSILLGSAMLWMVPYLLGSESVAEPTGLLLLVGAFRTLGPPLGIAALLLPWWMGARFAPGAREHGLAAKLAARPGSVDPMGLPLDAQERAWLEVRREQIGQEAAAVELAHELNSQGRARVRLLRQLGPMLALSVGVLALLPWAGLHLGLVFQFAGRLGAGP